MLRSRDRAGDLRTAATWRRHVGLAAAVLVALAACSADDSSTSPGSEATAVLADTSTGDAVTPPDPTASIDPGLQPYIDIAVADLAARLQIAPDDITTLSAVLVVWPDASLGCPKPDMQYAQVQTDGAKIVLRADGSSYDYHAGGDTTPFLCDPKGTVGSSTTSG